MTKIIFRGKNAVKKTVSFMKKLSTDDNVYDRKVKVFSSKKKGKKLILTFKRKMKRLFN